MSRPVKVLLTSLSVVVVAAVTAACGTEKISVPKTDPNYKSDSAGAQLFSQRCSGCHTLSYAATHGSAANVRTREAINGPNFDVRCERPVTRVLYAIENGGFSGAYMPANVVVGQDAREVAEFVSRYAGRKAPGIPGVTPCVDEAIGSLPPSGGAASATTTPSLGTASTTPTPGATVTTPTTPTTAAHTPVPKRSAAAGTKQAGKPVPAKKK